MDTTYHADTEDVMESMQEWHIERVDRNAYGPCGVCGELLYEGDEIGEFVDRDEAHILAHSECGLTSGLAVA